MADAVDRFHAHLDACRRCERHPFDLCATGQTLLVAAAQESHALVAPEETGDEGDRRG